MLAYGWCQREKIGKVNSFGIARGLEYIESDQEGCIVQNDSAGIIKLFRHQKIGSKCFKQFAYSNKVYDVSW